MANDQQSIIMNQSAYQYCSISPVVHVIENSLFWMHWNILDLDSNTETVKYYAHCRIAPLTMRSARTKQNRKNENPFNIFLLQLAQLYVYFNGLNATGRINFENFHN